MNGKKRGCSDVLPQRTGNWPGPHDRKRNRLQALCWQLPGRTSEFILFRRRRHSINGRFFQGTGGRGSLTVEAALVLPLFWYFLSGFLCFFLLFRMQEDISQALADAGRELGQYAYSTDAGGLSAQGVGLWTVKEKIKAVCQDKAALAFVDGKISGISLSKSRILQEDSKIELIAEYQMRLPWFLLGKQSIPVIQKQVCRAWTGYSKGMDGSDEEIYVYITPYGTVYHQSPDCKYLDLSIQMIPKADWKEKRNKNGERYGSCEKCCNGSDNGGMVYVTGYGNRCHESLSCSGLKRTVYLVPLPEAQGRGACKGC